MKYVMALAVSVMLGACAQPTTEKLAFDGVQLSISRFNAQIDNVSGSVDLSFTVKNLFPVPLKGISIYLVPRDADGQVIPGANLQLQSARAIAAGEIVGPIRVNAYTQGYQVSCVELYQVRTALPDYSIRLASGAEALNLVDGKTTSLCAPSEGEKAAG